LLDDALWRRFDEVLTFKTPAVQQIRQLLRLRLRRVPHAGIDIDKTASQLKGLPHSAGEKLVADARRHALLRNSDKVEAVDIEAVVHGVVTRPW
jgi:AAA+ superfamily predicted ATPase